jgi:hypothetical protein
MKRRTHRWPGPRRPHFDIFRARLAEQGYVEGKNLRWGPPRSCYQS